MSICFEDYLTGVQPVIFFQNLSLEIIKIGITLKSFHIWTYYLTLCLFSVLMIFLNFFQRNGLDTLCKSSLSLLLFKATIITFLIGNHVLRVLSIIILFYVALKTLISYSIAKLKYIKRLDNMLVNVYLTGWLP